MAQALTDMLAAAAAVMGPALDKMVPCAVPRPPRGR